MFNKNFFSQMRRSGMGPGISKAKLSQAMMEILLQLPKGTTRLKENIVANMGLMGQMSSARDINEAWNQTKKKAAKLYPDKFILDNRNALIWNDGYVEILDKKISPTNYKKLNEIANIENCTVNALISKLIKAYKKKNA